MTPKEKKAFVARMKKGKKDAAKQSGIGLSASERRKLQTKIVSARDKSFEHRGGKSATNTKRKTSGDKTTMKTTTGYIVSSPRYPNGRIFASKDDAIKEYHRQQKYGGAGYSDKTTIRSKNPKYHKRGKYWTP